ncbi:hypothetical protein D3C80_2218370 [compost metagenome]
MAIHLAFHVQLGQRLLAQRRQQKTSLGKLFSDACMSAQDKGIGCLGPHGSFQRPQHQHALRL